MPNLAKPHATNNPRPRFRTPPWHDQHPALRDIEAALAPDHLARTIQQAVAQLDLQGLYASYANTGSAAHLPELLLAVVLFEMRRGHHCPAEWHLHANESNPVRWLLRGSVVARSCWYAFRDRLAPHVDDLNAQVLHAAVTSGITPATRAAGDGTTVAANASRHKVVHQEQCQKRLDQVTAAIASFGQPSPDDAPALAQATTPPEPARLPLPVVPAVVSQPQQPVAALAPAQPAWLAATPAGRQQQQRRLQEALARLHELHADNQRKWPSKRKAKERIFVSLSDPEATVGRDKEKVFRPLYNVQLFDDLDSPLILGYAALSQQNDSGVLGWMLTRVEQLVGHRLKEVLVDASYAGGGDLAAAQQADVTVYAPVPGDGVKNPKQIPKREFVWQAAQQVYVCPQGQRLELEESWLEKRVDGKVRVWRYRCASEHCLGCPLQPRCTKTPAKGRAVQRLEHEELVEGLRARMSTAAAKELYRLRSQNVELINGDIKQHRKLRRFSGSGLLRIAAEVGLLVLAHNLVVLSQAPQKVAKQDGEATVSREENST